MISRLGLSGWTSATSDNGASHVCLWTSSDRLFGSLSHYSQSRPACASERVELPAYFFRFSIFSLCRLAHCSQQNVYRFPSITVLYPASLQPSAAISDLQKSHRTNSVVTFSPLSVSCSSLRLRRATRQRPSWNSAS